MKPIPLSPEELAVVRDLEHRVYFELIKGMTVEEMRSFDCYKPVEMRHYMAVQREWLEQERYLVGTRKGGSSNVTAKDLVEDFNLHHNGERFKTYYVLRFPDRVQRL